MDWIIFALVGYTINAAVSLMDRFMVAAKKVPNPFMYAYYVCLLSGGSLIAFLFDPVATALGFSDVFPQWSAVRWPDVETVIVSIVAGGTLFLALYLMYESLRRRYASDVIPVVTAVAAVTALAAELSLGRSLSTSMLIGVVLVIVGTLLISHFRFDRITRVFAVGSGIAFGLNTVIMGFLLNRDFDNGFLWSRFGLAVVAVVAYAIVILPYHKVTKRPKLSAKTHARGIAWVVSNKLLAGVAAILIFRGIEGGSPAVVQALAGVQFIALLAFGLLFGNKTSPEYGEDYTRDEVAQKILSVLFVIAGLVFIFLP